jgi:hypothetical protein
VGRRRPAGGRSGGRKLGLVGALMSQVFAAIQQVLYVQGNDVPDILNGFPVSVALRITALQLLGEDKVSISIVLNHYRETIDSGLGADYLFGQVNFLLAV